MSKIKIFGFFLSAIFLILSIYSLDFRHIAQSFRSADYRFVFVSIILFLLSNVIRSMLWGKLLGKIDISHFRLFFHLMLGLMANNIFPARLGEFVRAYSVGSEAHISRTRVFSSIIIERILDVVWLFIFVLSAFFLHGISMWPIYIARFTFGLLVLVFLFFFFFFKLREKCIDLILLIVPQGIRARLEVNLKFYSSMLISGFETLSIQDMLIAILLSFFSWVMWIFFLKTSLLIFHLNLTWLQTILLTGVINLGVMIPSAPGYIGTFQFVTIKGLSLFNIDPNTAFSFSILFHSLWYIPTTIIGILSMFYLGENIFVRDVKKIKQDI